MNILQDCRRSRRSRYGVRIGAAGASRDIVGCLAQAGNQPFRIRLRRADVHASWDVLLVGAAAILDARQLRPPDRSVVRCDLVYPYLSHLPRSPQYAFFMDLCGLWGIHLLLQHYSLRGSVDDLARDLLALGVYQTPDRSVFGSDRRRASFPHSQSLNVDSSRESLGGAKGAIGDSPSRIGGSARPTDCLTALWSGKNESATRTTGAAAGVRDRTEIEERQQHSLCLRSPAGIAS
jgi:hypothetical protein